MGCGNSKTGVSISNEKNNHTISRNGKSVHIEESDDSINKIVQEPKEPTFIEETSRTVSNTAEISPAVIQGSNEEINNVKQLKIKPPKKRKKDLVPDISIFKAIDEHAANAPVSSKTSVEELSKYLCRPAKNHLEEVRAFYKWIQLNIRYDTDAFFSGNIGSCSPDAVLRDGSSVCAGYANLFDALCKHAGVISRCISGYAKGYSYKRDEPITLKNETNHAWNVVFLFGEWHFVECTWGTGHVNNQHEFIRENTEFWFLTEPEHFINDHFPYMDGDIEASQQWQLLQRTMDLETYNKRVKVETTSQEYGLQYSHNEAIILVQEKLQVTIRTSSKPLETFNATFTKEDGTKCNQFVMAELVDYNKYIVTIKPPSQSVFHLKISGNNQNENLLHQLVLFTIKCHKVENNLRPYPELFGIWGAAEDVTEYGFSERVGSHFHHVVDAGEQDITLSVLKETPVLAKLHHAEMDIHDIDSFLMLRSTPSSIVARLRLPKEGYYKLSIFSKHSDSKDNNYELIINLMIECTKALKPCYAFPEVYSLALKHQVTLIEPLMRDIPANSETTFIFTSRILNRVLAAKRIIEKPSSDRWKFSVITPARGEKFTLFGSDIEDTDTYNALFEFNTI